MGSDNGFLLYRGFSPWPHPITSLLGGDLRVAPLFVGLEIMCMALGGFCAVFP